MSSSAPSDLDKNVFYVHVMRKIDAPVETVWNALTDLPKYHEWNPFVREMIITDAKKQPEEAQVLAVNKYLLMTCHIPPFTKRVFERVTTVDQDNHRLAWLNIDYPSSALQAERWQVLRSVEGNRTQYETWEAFNGTLAYFVQVFIGKKLREQFEAFADGLKTRCEG